VLVAAVILAAPALGYGQGSQAPSGAPAPSSASTPGAQPGSPEAPAPPVLEQGALDLLKRMSQTLSAAKAFTYRARHTVEVPAKTGQFVTLFGASEVALARPNKLYVRVTGEVPNFEFQYDGSSVAAYAARNHVYSVANAPDTIDAMLPFLEEKTGIHFATADIMFSDPYAALTKDLVGAFVVGPATVDGMACEHLAFRGPGVHWEIWIEIGKRALPRRLAVTYTGVTNFPRFLVEFSDWNLQPKLAASRFVFKKPADAKQIEFRAGPGPAAQ
jgi:hypothetical protein